MSRERTRWDKIEREFDQGPRWGWAGLAISAVVLLGVVTIILGFFLGWFSRGVEIIGPDNVAEQHLQVAEEWQALQAAAANACLAGDPDRDKGAPTLVEDPAMAYAATYRNIAASYNRRMANIFEAGIVAPPGYPDRVSIPTGAVEWCTLSEGMASIP